MSVNNYFQATYIYEFGKNKVYPGCQIPFPRASLKYLPWLVKPCYVLPKRNSMRKWGVAIRLKHGQTFITLKEQS